MEINRNILRSAIDTYGKTAQMIVCIEECAELQKELCKAYREEYTYGPIGFNVEHIAEEIADVYIMLGQMAIAFKAEETVADYLLKKQERLAERIANADTYNRG